MPVSRTDCSKGVILGSLVFGVTQNTDKHVAELSVLGINRKINKNKPSYQGDKKIAGNLKNLHPCECKSTLMVERRVDSGCVNFSVFDLGALCSYIVTESCLVLSQQLTSELYFTS